MIWTVMCKIKQKSNKVFFVPNPVQTDAKYKKIVLNQRLEIFGLESKIHIFLNSQFILTFLIGVSKCVSSHFSDIHVKVKLE